VVSGALSDIAADLTDAGLDATDVEVLLVLAAAHQSVLDEIDEPRLLHGDLWTVNVMVAIDGDEPRVTGVLDSDRTLWGDPLADWTVFMIRQRPPADEKAFWAGYGPPPTETAESRLRNSSIAPASRGRSGSSCTGCTGPKPSLTPIRRWPRLCRASARIADNPSHHAQPGFRRYASVHPWVVLAIFLVGEHDQCRPPSSY